MPFCSKLTDTMLIFCYATNATSGQLQRPEARGPRGPRGRTGPAGPAGSANGELKRLAAQLESVVKELQTQLMRIAQMQTQIDRLAAGLPAAPSERRRTPRTTEH